MNERAEKGYPPQDIQCVNMVFSKGHDFSFDLGAFNRRSNAGWNGEYVVEE